MTEGTCHPGDRTGGNRIGIPEIYRNVRRNYVRLGGTRLPTISQLLCYTEDGDGEKGCKGRRDNETLGYCCFVSFIFTLYLFLGFFYLFIFFLSKITYSKLARLFIITGFCGAQVYVIEFFIGN